MQVIVTWLAVRLCFPDVLKDGIVNVSAKGQFRYRVSLLCSHSSQRLDKATNKDQSMTILASSGLNDEDIQRMVNDAEQFAEADKSRRAIIEEAHR